MVVVRDSAAAGRGQGQGQWGRGSGAGVVGQGQWGRGGGGGGESQGQEQGRGQRQGGGQAVQAVGSTALKTQPQGARWHGCQVSRIDPCGCGGSSPSLHSVQQQYSCTGTLGLQQYSCRARWAHWKCCAGRNERWRRRTQRVPGCRSAPARLLTGRTGKQSCQSAPPPAGRQQVSKAGGAQQVRLQVQQAGRHASQPAGG